MYIFDLDGTLTDSNGLWGAVDDEFLARRGLKSTPEYTEMVGHAIVPTAAQYTRDYYGLDESPESIMAEALSNSVGQGIFASAACWRASSKRSGLMSAMAVSATSGHLPL